MRQLKIFITLLYSLSVITGLILLIAYTLGFRPYIVLSGSMDPAISTGSVVFTDSRSAFPKPGDIITYKSSGQYVTHRAVHISEDGYIITKGDANQTEDTSPVSPKQVIGTVSFTIPWIGYLVMFLHTPYAFCLLICIILITNLYQHILKFHPHKKERNIS